MNSSQKNVVVGVGSALVDILSHEEDRFLKDLNAAKGGMIPVESDYIERTLSLLSKEPIIVPGGSACNTVIGVGKLGGRARFIGKKGKDKFGDLFEEDLKNNNVEPVLFTSTLSTGRVLSIITPDAQRTMLTYLGASSEMNPNEISESDFSDSLIVHIEGYLLFNKDLILTVLQAAKQAGAKVSLDLASFTVVEHSKDILDQIVCDYVDILLANEDEARSFSGIADEQKAIEYLSENVEIAVLKLGKRGSLISCDKKITEITAKGSGEAVDTTGAGDLWASGFLYGLVKGLPLKKCGEIGSACGYEVCQVVGANIPEEGWKRIDTLL